MNRRVLISLLLLLSLDTHASLTRLSTFGTQPVFSSAMGSLPSSFATNTVNGSLWVDDDYNIFYNPSYVNEFKNQIVFQKGLEAGYFQSISERMAAGVYVNRGGTLGWGHGAYNSGAQRQYAPGLIAPGIREIGGMGGFNYYTGGTNGASIETRAPLDLFLSSDWGVKWGLHFSHAESPLYRKGNEKNARYSHLDGGVQLFGFEPFFGMTFGTEVRYTKPELGPSNQGTQTLDEFNIGTRFRYEAWSPYFVYKRTAMSGVPMANPVVMAPREISTRMHIVGFGLGHENEFAPGTKFFKHLGAYMCSVDDKDVPLADQVFPKIYRGYTQYTIPMNLGVEHQWNEWVLLRAGLSQNLLNTANYGADKPDANTAKSNLKVLPPEVRIGTTVKWTQYSLDLAVGNGTAVRNEHDANGGPGRKSEFFGTASATYRWATY